MALSEDQVCAAVGAHLKREGFPAVKWVPAGAQGIDIQCGPTADHPGWMIEAKGATSSKGGPKAQPFPNGAIFAGVSQAFNTAVCFRDREDRNGRQVGFAIPSGGWFEVHSQKLERACSELGIAIFRVDDDRRVRVTLPQAR